MATEQSVAQTSGARSVPIKSGLYRRPVVGGALNISSPWRSWRCILEVCDARAARYNMDLDDYLGPQPKIHDLVAKDRWQAIDELVGHLVADQQIRAEHRNAITAAVRKREESMSTGIGFGIGLPHASTDLVSEVIVAVGRSGKGIQFDALDSKPVRLVLLFLVPKAQFQKHINTLANLAKLLHRQDFRDGLFGRFMSP